MKKIAFLSLLALGGFMFAQDAAPDAAKAEPMPTVESLQKKISGLEKSLAASEAYTLEMMAKDLDIIKKLRTENRELKRRAEAIFEANAQEGETDKNFQQLKNENEILKKRIAILEELLSQDQPAVADQSAAKPARKSIYDAPQEKLTESKNVIAKRAEKIDRDIMDFKHDKDEEREKAELEKKAKEEAERIEKEEAENSEEKKSFWDSIFPF